jgi:hypothetical protein
MAALGSRAILFIDDIHNLVPAMGSAVRIAGMQSGSGSGLAGAGNRAGSGWVAWTPVYSTDPKHDPVDLALKTILASVVMGMGRYGIHSKARQNEHTRVGCAGLHDGGCCPSLNPRPHTTRPRKCAHVIRALGLTRRLTRRAGLDDGAGPVRRAHVLWQ